MASVGLSKEGRLFIPKVKWSAVFIATLLLGSLPARSQQGVTADTIVIGAYGALSGPASFAGLGGRDGAMLAIKEINAAGGVHGRQIRATFEDDANSPTKALAAVKKLIEQDKVFAIFSVATSNSVTATIDYANEAGLVMYVSFASAPRVTYPFKRNLFRGSTSESARYGEVNAEFIATYLKAKKVGYLSSRDEYSKNEANFVQSQLKDNFGVTVVRTEFNIGDKDFTPQLIELQTAAPDVIAISGYPADGAIIMRQARELGLKQQIFVGGALVDDTTLKNAGPAAEGTFGFTLLPYLTSSTNPAMMDWVQKWKKEYPGAPAGRPNAFDVLAYTDMYAFAEGLKNAGPDLTTDKLINGLEQLKNYRVSEIGVPISFSTKYHIGNLRMQANAVKDGSWRDLAWESKGESAILKRYE
jgi:branched-chain amino acid transport system substrate-binding protein